MKKIMEKIFIVSVIVYLVGALSHQGYTEHLDYLNTTSGEARLDFSLRVFRDIGISVAVSVAIIFSISMYQEMGNSIKANFYLISSILFCLCLAASSFYLYHKTADLRSDKFISKMRGPKFIEKYEARLVDERESLEVRAKWSREVARSIFVETGRVENIVTVNGKVALYVPTAEDKKLRSESVRAYQLLDYTTQSLKLAGYGWTGILIISVSIGFVLARRRRNRPWPGGQT